MESTYQGRRSRRSFSEQYKAEVVALCQGSEKSMSEIAGDLGHRLLAALAEGHDLRLVLLAERPSRPPALICALHASTSFPGTEALSWMSVRTGQAQSISRMVCATSDLCTRFSGGT